MRKDIRRISLKQSIMTPWRLSLMIIFFIMVLSCLVYFMQKNKNHFSSSFFSTSLNTWIAKHRNRLQQKLAEAKPEITALKKEPDNKIHFEFYTALPNMQVKKRESNVVVATVSKKSMRPITIVDPAELERELSEKIKQNTYVIQLGVFSTVSTAEQYRASLALMNIKANIVKIGSINKASYRVQMGPFLTKEQAKTMQRDLFKKGLSNVTHQHFFIRQISEN